MSRIVSKVFKLISSKTALIWLAAGWLVMYVTLAAWSGEAFARFAAWLTSTPPVQGMYLLFLLVGVLNLIRALGGRAGADEGRGVRGGSLAGLAAWAVLPAALLIFLAAFFISLNLRQSQWLLVGEGDRMSPRWDDKTYLVEPIDSPIKEKFLYSGTESVFAREPSLTLSADGRRHRVGAYPPTRIGGSYYHILQFGLAPGYILFEGGSIRQRGFAPLRILPPGNVDVMEIKPYPYRFEIRLAPERIIEKGRERMKAYDLSDPKFALTVMRGEDTVFEGDGLRSAQFEGVEVAFTKPTYWALVEVVRDPSIWALAGSLALVLLGLLLRALAAALWVLRTMAGTAGPAGPASPASNE